MKTNLAYRLLLLSLAITIALFVYCAITLSSNVEKSNHGQPIPSLDPDRLGSFAATTDIKIPLNDTEGKSFKLTGQVWLNGRSTTAEYPEEAPDGFSLLIRQTNPTHRYDFTSRYTRDKRRLLDGQPEKTIVKQATLPNPPLHEWIPFSLVAAADKITFQFGKNSTTMAGPLDTTGTNQIDLIAGSKLQNVQVEILGDAKAD